MFRKTLILGLFASAALASCKKKTEPSTASSEKVKEVELVPDAAFDKTYASKILPFIEGGKRSYFKASQDTQLETISFDKEGANANVIVVHGFGQNYRSFSEVMYNIWNNGFAVHAYSHVGHGCSEHLLLDKASNQANRESQCRGLTTQRNQKTYYAKPDYCKIHVENYEQYVADLKIFVDRVKSPGKKTYLYCHSMGGGICSRFLEEHPDAVDAAFLNAPMIQPKSAPLKHEDFDRLIEAAVVEKPLGYMIGSDEMAAEDVAGIKRENASLQMRAEANGKDGGYAAGLFRCGATNTQGRQMVYLSRDLRADANVAKVKVPVVIAGANDQLDHWVELAAIETFCSRVASCRYHVYDDSHHEIYNEPDSIRLPLMRDVVAFYQSPDEFLKSHAKKY